jgi:hypothetical protein
MFFEHYTHKQAYDLIGEQSKLYEMLPELKGKMHVYLYQLTEEIDQMDDKETS